MRILVYSFKGGTGKSTIALNWALTLDWGVITNDLYSPIDKVLEKKRVYKLQIGQPLPDLPEGVNVVYDFGGYVDDRVVKAMKDADAIIVPTTNAFAEIQVALETIKETERHNKHIVVVANKAGKGDFEYVQSAIRQFFKYPVLPLKATKALTRIYSSKKSLRAAADSENPLDRHAYTAAADQFDAIVAAITKRK